MLKFKFIQNYIFANMIANQMPLGKTFFYYSQLYSFIFSLFIFFTSCNNQKNNENRKPISLTFERFDLKFYNQPSGVIPKLKKEYSFLFPKQFSDSTWIKRQKDSLQLILQNAVQNEFPDLLDIESEITDLFEKINFQFPKINLSRVIFLTNNVDYQLKTVYGDSILLISLDTFLGSNHNLYNGIPNYIRKELDRKYIMPQILEKFASYSIPPPKERTFLAKILYEGKKMYLKDKFLPHLQDKIKIAYSDDEIKWVKNNERFIWQYFIEKQLLYKTDSELTERFIKPAPFSKFYLQIDNESPGKIGVWIGWQIVRSFFKHNPEFPLIEFLNLSSQELFNFSKYKPQR